MENEETRTSFIVPIKKEYDGIRVKLEPGYWVNLQNIIDDYEDKENGRLWKYFIAFLSLIKALCFERNYKGINNFTEIYPFDLCFHAAQDPDIPLIIRSRFVGLIQHLHVDRDPLEPMIVPRLTRVWDEIDDEAEGRDEDDMPTKNEIPYLLNELPEFVRDYLLDVRVKQLSYEVDKNDMTLSVLELTEALILFGFFKTQKELVEVVDPLITLMDGS